MKPEPRMIQKFPTARSDKVWTTLLRKSTSRSYYKSIKYYVYAGKVYYKTY